MNQEESMMSSGYEASSAEIQSVILKWAEATEAFHRRYAKLNDVINRLQKATGRQQVANRTRLRNLEQMRDQMSDILMMLLMEMSGQQSNRSTLPSKPGQLRTHTSLLCELSRKIDIELIGFTTVAQA